MRFPFPILAAAFVAGCGQSGPEGAAEADNGAGVTVPLPPPLPATVVAEAPKAAKAPPRAKAEPSAPPKEAMSLVPSAPPIPQSSLAGYIGRAGFDCDQVVAVSRMQGASGRRAGIYKFDCATGGSYQGTMRSNHLYFRPWTGNPR